MFRIVADQVLSLQGAGGVPFTAFVDGLVRAHGTVHGVPDVELQTNIRTNIGDEGADTLVRVPFVGDTTGWFSERTVWQYKGTGYAGTNLASLLKGDFLQQRIRDGYAFRLAIADSMPAVTRQEWEETLTAGVLKLNPAAPPALIVTADDLGAWAGRYPALVIRFFRPELAGSLLTLEAWGKNVLDTTPKFVPVPHWEQIRNDLKKHVDLASSAASAVRTVQGEAGVGKTRLVYEIAAAVPGAIGLVVCCQDDGAAMTVARTLANDNLAHAILVADECSASARAKLSGILVGHRGRVRAIAIDNTGVRADSPEPELWLSKMPTESLDDVLQTNFPAVAPERRRAYRDLAQGYPRLAADLCQYDPLVGPSGHLGPVVRHIGDYLHLRLTSDQRIALEAISLLTKVGYAGDVRGELDLLCSFLDLNRGAVQQSLDSIHDGTGFAARSPRYFYTTPEIIAQIAFASAWQRWAREPERFLATLPTEFVQSFLGRVNSSADQEVRRRCGEYFWHWARELRAEDLTDLASVLLLEALTEALPSDYLPHVRRLIEAAQLDDLAKIRGESLNGEWGPRRRLVWLCERLVQFPEFFDDSERILLRLALAESEPNIGNNATAIWRQLYRIQLSGSATGFEERLTRLESRLNSSDPKLRQLAATALTEALSSHSTRMLGPSVVGGRIPPPDWRPRTYGEQDTAVRGLLSLLSKATQDQPDLRDPLMAGIVRQLRSFLSRGYLSVIQEIFAGTPLTDSQRAVLIEEIDSALLYDAPHAERWGGDLEEQVREWRRSLIGDNLHGQVVATVGKQRWGATRLSSNDWQESLIEVAQQLLQKPEDLRAELSWLSSVDAHAAGELGYEIGVRDSGATLLPVVLGSALNAPSLAFVRGYVNGLLREHPEFSPNLNEWLDKYVEENPEAVVQVAMSGGRLTGALRRTLELFDAGRIGSLFLYERNFTEHDKPLVDSELLQLLTRLAKAAAAGDSSAVRIGVDNVALRLRDYEAKSPDPLLANKELREAIWGILEAVPPEGLVGTHFWPEVLIHLGHYDGDRSARYAANLLAGENFNVRDGAERALGRLARITPAPVVEALGAIMLDEQTGWRFYLGKFDELIAALPQDLLIEWMQRVGAEGARHLARHLPEPYLDDHGLPIVPPLTAWVLSEFEEDDRTFKEFVAGVGSLKVYSGDIDAEHRSEAAVAKRFRDHPMRRIREWAELRERMALADAERARIWQEESDLP